MGGPSVMMVVRSAIGLRWETDDDGHRPHRFPDSARGEEILGWECQACGEWIREFGPIDRTECSVDWRSKGQRRLASKWVSAS